MSIVPIPSFSYNPGSGLVTFSPTYPPVHKPGPQDGTSDELEAQRVDSITMSGKKQVFYIRTDIFRVLEFTSVPFADFVNWSPFMAWAVSGGQFDYYPDATLPAFTSYTLEDTSWKPKFAFMGVSGFTLQMRQLV
jgi:hypothetical protein